MSDTAVERVQRSVLLVTVAVVVGKEQSPVSVPNVVGQDVNGARQTLSNAGFGVQVRTSPTAASMPRSRAALTISGELSHASTAASGQR